MRVIMQKTLDLMISKGYTRKAQKILKASTGFYYIGDISFFIYEFKEDRK